MVDDAKKAEGVVGLVPQLMVFERRDERDIVDGECLACLAAHEYTRTPRADHDMSMDMALQARVATGLNFEVAQIGARLLTELADQLDATYALERLVCGVLVGARVAP